MTKTILCVGLSALFLLASIHLFAQPKLQVVEGPKLDLGSIARGAVIEKKVSLKNTGNEVLVIGKVEASCGCTGTVMSDDHIAPGKSGTLLITFNSKNFSGVIHKSVTVNSNSTGQPQTVIEFTGTVIEEVSILPSQVLFRDAEVGRLSSRTITVTNQGKEPLTLTGYRSQLGGLSVKLPSHPIAPKDSVTLVIEFTPKDAKPVLSDLLYITTSNTSQTEVTVYVYGNTREFKFQ